MEINSPIIDFNKDQSLLKLLIDSQSDLICYYDPQYRLLFSNQAYADFFGFKTEQIKGFNLLDLVDEDEREVFLEKLQHHNKTRKTVKDEALITDAQGKAHWIEWTDIPISNEEGDLLFWQSIGKNITTLKLQAIKQEEENIRFKLALDGAHAGTWEWYATEQSPQIWSEGTYKLLGLAYPTCSRICSKLV